VEVVGPIIESRDIVRQLREYRTDKRIASVVLRIDSPGGGVGASQEIYAEVKRVKESGRPVVASLGSVAASGAFYVACAADTIVSGPGTVTGSIGVLMEFPQTAELLRKVGLQFEVIKSGEHKDIGSPWRSMTPQERALLGELVEDVYEQFLAVVCRERGLTREEVLALADGRVFSGRQALKVKLVDVLGDEDDAIEVAARMGEIKGEPNVLRQRRRQRSLQDLLGGMSILGGLDPRPSSVTPRLQYIFAP
jgi:protease-4